MVLQPPPPPRGPARPPAVPGLEQWSPSAPARSQPSCECGCGGESRAAFPSLWMFRAAPAQLPGAAWGQPWALCGGCSRRVCTSRWRARVRASCVQMPWRLSAPAGRWPPVLTCVSAGMCDGGGAGPGRSWRPARGPLPSRLHCHGSRALPAPRPGARCLLAAQKPRPDF